MTDAERLRELRTALCAQIQSAMHNDGFTATGNDAAVIVGGVDVAVANGCRHFQAEEKRIGQRAWMGIGERAGVDQVEHPKTQIDRGEERDQRQQELRPAERDGEIKTGRANRSA